MAISQLRSKCPTRYLACVTSRRFPARAARVGKSSQSCGSGKNGNVRGNTISPEPATGSSLLVRSCLEQGRHRWPHCRPWHHGLNHAWNIPSAWVYRLSHRHNHEQRPGPSNRRRRCVVAVSLRKGRANPTVPDSTITVHGLLRFTRCTPRAADSHVRAIDVYRPNDSTGRQHHLHCRHIHVRRRDRNLYAEFSGSE